MDSWNVILICLIQQICASSVSHYECGAHGKFEYCIDKQPGCVVGCHCHPGYYFDTDTKVCEPNHKLTQYRRHFDLEPTRVPIMEFESVTIPTLTTTLNPVDEKVEAIAKDTDDLGDWLYNQFFKTIENQVINNTENEPKTRRSGTITSIKPKRRSHKKNKKSKKKKYSKKGLRSKLLRITEDDSLFDSSSSSSSDESDSSSSESDGDSSDDHDHRQIVMINKKPTPPLPSFIFLPNVETPFYPPIGLPAPPIVPMYPMVPVPPMGMIYPGESTTASSSSQPTTVSASTSTETHSTALTSETTTLTANEETSSVSEPTSESIPAALRVGDRSGRYDEFLQNIPNNKMGPRNKFLRKMRDKMKKKNKPPHLRSFMEGLENAGAPPFINMRPGMPFDRSEFRQRYSEDEPKIEDVDFKYLSQLIHKVDLNNAEPRFPHNPMSNYAEFTPLTRKSNYQNLSPFYPNNMPNDGNDGVSQTYLLPHHKQRPVSKADDVNEAYFTHLGKQIASLIRKHEPNDGEEIDIEIQQQKLPSNLQTTNMLNENGLTQGRSYWERFVRSPLKTFLPYIKRNIQPMQSGEQLISIENQVNVATAIKKPLNLQELENMATFLEQTHLNENKIQYKTTERAFFSSSNNLYKFNLLPQINRRINTPDFLGNTSNEKNILHGKDNKTPGRYYNNFVRRLSPNEASQTRKNNTTHAAITQRNRTRSAEDMSKVKKIKTLLNLQQPYQTPLYQQVSKIVQRNITHAKSTSTNQFVKYNLNPLLFSYKTVNYVNNNHNLNKYHVQRSFLPYHLPVLKPMSSKTSYFHHELHHFDFFDK